MLSLAEIGPAVYGAWRLAHFDANGMRYFDRSIEGFWRSFRVALLAAPFSALLIAIQLSGMHVAGGWFRIVTGETIVYVISWVAFPLAIYYLAEVIDRRAQYVGFIVAYNWSALIQLGLFVPVSILAYSGILPSGLAGPVTIGAQIALLVYEWFIVRTALGLAGFAAAGVVAIDLVISILVNGVGELMVRAT